jgi:hypothetical protein
MEAPGERPGEHLAGSIPAVVYAPRVTAPRTATRLVYVRLIHPRTVHELDCPKLDLTLTKRNPMHYAAFPISDVPVNYPRCKICTPGVR